MSPRRLRLREILERAREAGAIDPHADLDLAVSTLVGSWYGYAVAGQTPPRDWARRNARHCWRALGGD